MQIANVKGAAIVRRLERQETFHGTTGGQSPTVTDLSVRYDLPERQAQCVAQLVMGVPATDLTEVLGISTSTLEKHLAELRRKFDVETTAALVAKLSTLVEASERDEYKSWPDQTNQPPLPSAPTSTLGAALRRAASLPEALEGLRAAWQDVGARHLYYCFVPHSVQGFLKGDVMDAFLATDAIEAAFRANSGLMGQPIALHLFNDPDSVPVIPLASNGPKSLVTFNAACRDGGASHIMGVGFPSGPGFVGMAVTLHSDSDPTDLIAERATQIRSDAMAMHASLLTQGTLAARVRLTVRERDALSALAIGKKASEAAAEMKISDRAFAKLAASARSKFGAATNAEAIYKASVVNALVFL